MAQAMWIQRKWQGVVEKLRSQRWLGGELGNFDEFRGGDNIINIINLPSGSWRSWNPLLGIFLGLAIRFVQNVADLRTWG